MSAADRILARLRDTERMQDLHRANGRSIDAAVCAIRAQALREALADARGKDAPALRSFTPKRGD